MHCLHCQYVLFIICIIMRDIKAETFCLKSIVHELVPKQKTNFCFAFKSSFDQF